jgi:signal transduction histidine kinase
LLIDDTHTDPTFQLHRATATSPGIGSFLGVPIIFSDGTFFGTLCAIDPDAQTLSRAQADLLLVLGRIIATHIERDREIDSRKQAEATQAVLYEAAQHALREREVFLAIASHELKNPLTSLLGYAALLQRRKLGEERDQRAVRNIVIQAERLNRMLNDLLDVARLESGQFFMDHLPVDLSTLVYKMVEEAQPSLTNHTLTLQDNDSPLLILGDEERLAQVLRNVISNAIKYTLPGGKIHLRVAIEHERACVVIQDEGIGIPTDALPNIFQRFYRASNTAVHAIHGFGIGLYVVKEILTRHSGTIAIASTEGVGTTCTLSLPLLRPSP